MELSNFQYKLIIQRESYFKKFTCLSICSHAPFLMKQYLGIIVPKQHDALRLDAFLKKVLPPLERITVLRMLKDKEIRVEKKNSTGGDVDAFKLEPIEQHSFKSSVLQLLQETEPMVISSSSSHYVLASSTTDRKKRSEYVNVCFLLLLLRFFPP